MKILVSGGDSNFSKELKKLNYNGFVFLSKSEMDILDRKSIRNQIKKHSPDVFLHVAGLSRPMKYHDDKPKLSIDLNIIGTSNCVIECIDSNTKIVYISTDYVYPGINGDYKEDGDLNPINSYAWSKLGGECSVRLYKNSLILRMAMTEVPFPHEKAFVDLIKSCLWYPDAAKLVLDVILSDKTGIYNVGGEPSTVFDFISKKQPTIGKGYRRDVNEVVPTNISMNLDKLKSI